jgi:hypothetical protein
MPAQSHARLLVRAAQMLGGEQALQAFLRVPAAQLKRWMHAESALPVEVFLKLVDLVSEHKTGRSVVLRAARAREHDTVEMARTNHRLFDPSFVPRDRAELLETALDATLAVAGTDLGNVQLIDPDGALRIKTHRGFEKPFLEFFSVVSQPECACGVAMSIGR